MRFVRCEVKLRCLSNYPPLLIWKELPILLIIHIQIKGQYKQFHADLRTSHSVVLSKIGILESFTKFAKQHLQAATLLKKRLWHMCFFVNFVKFLRSQLNMKLLDNINVSTFCSNMHLWFQYFEEKFKITSCNIHTGMLQAVSNLYEFIYIYIYINI